MTVSQTLNAFQRVFEEALGTHGVCSICSDLDHMWEQANMASSKLVVLLVYNGEEPRGDFNVADILNVVDRKFIALVKRGKSMTAKMGEDLANNTGNNIAFIDDLEHCRDLIRSVVLDTLERPVYYHGMRPAAQALGEKNVLAHSFFIDFSVCDQIPALLSTPEDPTPDNANIIPP